MQENFGLIFRAIRDRVSLMFFLQRNGLALAFLHFPGGSSTPSLPGPVTPNILLRRAQFKLLGSLALSYLCLLLFTDPWEADHASLCHNWNPIVSDLVIEI